MSNDLNRLAAEAVDALRRLRAAAYGECSGLAPDETEDPEFRLQWVPGTSPAELADAALTAALVNASERAAVRTGHVYCYSCRSASCEHSAPPEAGSVFAGYESTGRPSWQEFFNFLLVIGDERTDQLFASRPEILSRVIGRRRLTGDQLVSFGRNSYTYRIWGQVVAGYLTVSGDRSALTVQLVEDKGHGLHLQVVAVPGVREALAEAPEDRRSAFHRVYDAVSEARRQVASLSAERHPPPEERDGRGRLDKGFAILRHLAHSIERKGRQQQRRTAHAEIRGGQQRPVHKAREDVREAGAGDVYRDAFRGSLIVSGKAGRIHVYNDKGRHITSMVIRGDELERRISRKRYVPLAAEEAGLFRHTVLEQDPAAADNAER